jgi:drug/metabolite transporter (DMT)-like permease
VASTLALIAALLFAVAATLQQKGALTLGVGEVSMGSPKSLLRLAEQRMWLAGSVALLVGYVVQAAALDRGRLAIIQPLLVTTIVFALPLGYFLTSQYVGRREIVGAAVVVLGLALYSIVGDPAGGRDNAPGWEWAIALAVVALTCGALLALGRGATAAVRAAVYGTVAGILFGTSACLVKPTVETLHDGLGEVFAHWEFDAMAGAGIAAFVLQQVSLSTGRLATSVATVAVANPVVSVVIGVTLFEERLSKPTWHVVVATTGLALALLGGAAISMAREGRYRGGASGAGKRVGYGLATTSRRDRSQRLLAVRDREEVVDDEPGHRLARLPCGAADVGRQHDVRQVEELVRDIGLVDEDVEPRIDSARQELGHEGRLVDDLAPRRVDEARAVAEERQAASVDQSRRLRRERNVDGHDVRLGEQCVEVPELGEVGVDLPPARVEDAEVEAVGSSGDGSADPAESDDAQRRPGDLLRQVPLRPGSRPGARADEPVSLGDLSPRRQNQREGQVRNRAVEDARCVGDDDAARRAGDDVDAVVADPEVRDHTQVRKQVERHGLVREHEPLDVGPRRIELAERPDLEVVELVERRPGVAARRQDFHGPSIQEPGSG